MDAPPDADTPDADAAVTPTPDAAAGVAPTAAAGATTTAAGATDADAGAAETAARAGGGGIVTWDWGVTGAFLAMTIVAVVVPDTAADVVAGVDVALFAAGLVAFLWAYVVAVQRSRTAEVSIGGVYFLAGETAPADVRTRLRVALAIQVAGAIVAASIRPFTPVAFAVLVPMLGLGLMGLWGARNGAFPARASG